MHLSPEFGLAYNQIEKDGFKIDKKIEMLLSSDTPVGISKSMGLGMIGADAYADLKPDIVVLLGDRFEVFSAAAAMIARVLSRHGSIDDYIDFLSDNIESVQFIPSIKITKDYKL